VEYIGERRSQRCGGGTYRFFITRRVPLEGPSGDNLGQLNGVPIKESKQEEVLEWCLVGRTNLKGCQYGTKALESSNENLVHRAISTKNSGSLEGRKEKKKK
jgi:hypothetical protein